jgi:cell division protein FtsB
MPDTRDKPSAPSALDSQRLVNLLGAIVFAFFGWWGNNIWNSVQSQQQQITQLNIELAKSYVPRVELQEQFNRINAKLDQIVDQQTRKSGHDVR